LDVIPWAGIQEIRGFFAYGARSPLLTMFRLRG
jgi:hypothetical protein